jgi:hypothetical protein
VGQLVGRLWAAELVDWFVGLLAGCLFVCLFARLFVCLLVGWLVCRADGSFIRPSTSGYRTSIALWLVG